MDIFGIFDNKKRDILINNKKVLDDIVIFIRGKIFNINDIRTKYKIKFKKLELILKELYKLKGIEFLNELDGSFAIVIYDKKKDKVYLIKDKLGNEFLYYYYNKKVFMFSTSLKLIMNHNKFVKTIDKQVLANYLGYMYIYEPYTIFLNTFKVSKGTFVTFDGKKLEKNNYFNLWNEYEKSKKLKFACEKDLIEDFTDLFKKSISKRGSKSSQIGVFMSSGKDSTFIAKLASECYTKRINTYTLSFENERDESIGAEKIANYIGSNHHTILLKDQDVIKTIQKIPEFYDEPFADPSIIPSIYLAENIKDKNDFYLTGEGNDAIFMHSKMYQIYDFYPNMKLKIRKSIRLLKGERTYHNFSEMAQVNIINRFRYSDKILGMKGKVYMLKKEKEKIRSAVLGDITNTISEKYKVKTGALAKYYGLEYYTPYYDLGILLKTFEIPTNMMYRNKAGKFIFNKILFEHIPKYYYDTYKKNGFGIPLVEWTKRIFLKEIENITKKEKIEKQNLFSYSKLINLIGDFKKNPNYDKAVVLWCYYVFQLWYNHNIEN